MKKETYLKNKFSLIAILLFTFIAFTSCENEFQDDADPSTSAPPIITSVSRAQEDEPVTQGVLESTYIIRGENLSTLSQIYFNGVEAGFNPAFLTDAIAFVEIPEDAPYVGQDNIMRLVNASGTTDYGFSLLNIEDFTEETVGGVKLVTLVGGDFTDTNSVTFVSGTEEQGNLVETPATIVTTSETEVVVEVPDGIEQAFIFLATSRGAVAKSASYGFSYSIFIDALNPDWEMSQWGGTFDLQSSSPALGEFSIQSVREGWSGLTFLAPNIPFNEYTSITVSLYGTGTSGDSVNLAFNDFDGNSQPYNIALIPNEWTKVVIPLSAFYPNGGEPNTIFRLDFQESSGTGLPQYIFYVDDFGFL